LSEEQPPPPNASSRQPPSVSFYGGTIGWFHHVARIQNPVAAKRIEIFARLLISMLISGSVSVEQ
jgi:hypothetical protein